MSSVLVYGPPGSGKTTLASSLTKLNYHVYYLDLDRKVKTMKNLEHLHGEFGQPGRISWWEPQSPLHVGKLRDGILALDKPPSKRPEGYLELVDKVNELGASEPGTESSVVLVLDSLTKALEHMKRLILHLQKQGSLRLQDWGFILANLEELFDSFYSLPFAHCIINCHEMSHTDEFTGRTVLMPLIDGQMKHKAGAYVEEMYYTQVSASKTGTSYELYTKPLGRISQARSSRVETMCVPSDLSQLFDPPVEK